jgi:predicted RNase H-like HicB family nuclease
MANEFTAVIVPAEEGGYWAYCPEVPGANGQGETLDEVRENLAEANELMIEVRRGDALASIPPGAHRGLVRVG